jgi:hypothetical protein
MGKQIAGCRMLIPETISLDYWGSSRSSYSLLYFLDCLTIRYYRIARLSQPVVVAVPKGVPKVVHFERTVVPYAKRPQRDVSDFVLSLFRIKVVQ